MGTSASMQWRESDFEYDLSECEYDTYEQEDEYIENHEDDIQELEKRREDAFKRFNTAIDDIKQIHDRKDNNENWKEELRKTLENINKVYEEMGNIYYPAYDVVLKHRRKAGKKLCETKTTTVILVVVMDCWRVSKNEASENDTIKLLDSAITVLWNFSDSSPEVSRAIIKKRGFLETLKEILTSYLDLANREVGRQIDHITKGALSIVNNVSQVDKSIPSLRSLKMEATINPYLDIAEKEVALIALSALANILDEKQSEVLKDRDDVLQLLLHTLESALTNDNHRCNGFAPWECGLKAVGAIRVLAFDKDNQRNILERTDLRIIELLASLKDTSKDEKVKEDADNILWVLRERLQKNEKYKKIANSYIKEIVPDSTGHVMISYNWGHQKQVIQIRNALKKINFPVWMDIKNMRGAKYQDMAKAVEKARVVILCYSRKYKDSPNCRMEAEYAFDLKKPTIALKMEKDYKPDGWLAILIAGKIFIDFSGKYPFNKKVGELAKQLGSSFESADDVTDGDSETKQSVASLRKWTSTDVNNWIDRNKLPWQEFVGMTGRDLAGLFIMRNEAPECFYSRLKTDLKIESFATIDRLIEALDEFTN